MSDSSLVQYVDLAPHYYGKRNHVIDGITIHHMAGNLSVEACGRVFHNKCGSSNYGIGTDGRIAMYVHEDDAAGTSGNKANDERCVTIEVANTTEGVKNKTWEISHEAYLSLINLLVDICKRRNIKQLVWSNDKKTRVNHLNGANMTVHKDFAATACPGPYLMAMMPYIASEVTRILNENVPTPVPPTPKTVPYQVKVVDDNLNIRKGPGVNYKIVGQIKDHGIYTIVEEDATNKWGKLKSGAGWIYLGLTKKV